MPDDENVLRDSTLQGVVHDYQLFGENIIETWEPLWLADAKRKDNSRWRRFLRWIGADPRPTWKPCVQIECPPMEEHWISATWNECQR